MKEVVALIVEPLSDHRLNLGHAGLGDPERFRPKLRSEEPARVPEARLCEVEVGDLDQGYPSGDLTEALRHLIPRRYEGYDVHPPEVGVATEQTPAHDLPTGSSVTRGVTGQEKNPALGVR